MALIKLNNQSYTSANDFMPTGTIIQYASGTSTTSFLVSSPSGDHFPTTGKLTLNITPTSTSNKILVSWISTLRYDASTTDSGAAFILRETIGATVTDIKPDAQAYSSGFYYANQGSTKNMRPRLNYFVERTPNTTSQITYEIGMWGYNVSRLEMIDRGSTSYINAFEIKA